MTHRLWCHLYVCCDVIPVGGQLNGPFAFGQKRTELETNIGNGILGETEQGGKEVVLEEFATEEIND